MGTFSCVPNGTIEACSAAITFIPTLPGARKDALFLMNGSGTRVMRRFFWSWNGAGAACADSAGRCDPLRHQHAWELACLNSTVDENGTVYALSSSTNAITVMTKAGVVSNLPVTGLSSPRTDPSIDGGRRSVHSRLHR